MSKKKVKKPTTTTGKIWYFIWHDESILSLLVNVILAFIIIKFLVYPGMGAIFGTTYPVVAVVSDSMEHNAKFYDWWNANEDFYLKSNITDIDFREFSFINGFNKGDIMVLIGTDPEKIEIGDVIVYHAKKPYPIIHRVIHIRDTGGELYFTTKGDNNPNIIVSSELDERNVSKEQYIGKAVLRIPFIGYVKIWFVQFMSWFGLGGIVT